MKVLLTSHAYVVKENQKKAELLAKLGVELTVLTPRRWVHEFGEFSAYTDVSGFRLTSLDTVSTGDNNNFCYRGGLPSEEFDILHIEQEPWAVSARQLMLKIPAKRNIVFTWENILRRHHPIKDTEKWVLSHTSAIIAGNFGAREVITEKGYRGPVFVLPQFGVDTELFHPSPTERSHEFTVGYAGRLIEEKGVFELVRACAELDIKLLLAGAGAAESKLNKLARKLRFKKLTFLGAVERTRMPGFYNSLDAFVLASKTTKNWKEQFGMALAEAMSCEVAVIGSDSGAIPELIADAGLVVPEGNLPALTAGLLAYREEVSLRDDYARKARQRILSHFSAELIARRTLEIYEEVLRL